MIEHPPSLEHLRGVFARKRQPATLIDEPGFRKAAVLLPLIGGDAVSVLFTRRTETLPNHKGQIAFPGGRLEDGETPVQAALRETTEEIGVEAERVKIWGVMDEIWTPTGYAITPVVAELDSVAELIPNPREVARIFTAPLLFFADETAARKEEILVDGRVRPVYYYQYDGELIWGATSLMLRHLLVRLGLLENV